MFNLNRKQSAVEITCDRCQTTHLFEINLKNVDWLKVLDNDLKENGWLSTFSKKLKRYTHVCLECREASKAKFRQNVKKSEETILPIVD